MSKTYTLLVAGAAAGQCDRIDALLAGAGCYVTFVTTNAVRTAFVFEADFRLFELPGDVAELIAEIVAAVGLNPDTVDLAAGRLVVAAGASRA